MICERATDPLAVPRSGRPSYNMPTAPANEDQTRSPLQTLQHTANVCSKAEGRQDMGDFVLPMPVKGERVTSDGSSATTQSTPPSPSDHSPGLDADEGLDDEPAEKKEVLPDDDDAISALLSLQKDVTPPPSAPGGGYHVSRMGVSSSGPLKLGGISKSDGAMRFYCRFPGCGKGYVSALVSNHLLPSTTNRRVPSASHLLTFTSPLLLAGLHRRGAETLQAAPLGLVAPPWRRMPRTLLPLGRRPLLDALGDACIRTCIACIMIRRQATEACPHANWPHNMQATCP